jgi:hypothetical protein
MMTQAERLLRLTEKYLDEDEPKGGVRDKVQDILHTHGWVHDRDRAPMLSMYKNTRHSGELMVDWHNKASIEIHAFALTSSLLTRVKNIFTDAGLSVNNIAGMSRHTFAVS